MTLSLISMHSLPVDSLMECTRAARASLDHQPSPTQHVDIDKDNWGCQTGKSVLLSQPLPNFSLRYAYRTNLNRQEYITSVVRNNCVRMGCNERWKHVAY